MSKAPDTIYIPAFAGCTEYRTERTLDSDLCYVRDTIAYGYASEVERLKARLDAVTEQNIKDLRVFDAARTVLNQISRNASVLTAHQIETMARDALEKQA